MLIELENVKAEIYNWDTVLFSVFYHDIVYGSLEANDEVQSANLAQERLQLFGISAKQNDLCVEYILATREHKRSKDSDLNYFLDADMAILGTDWCEYESYMLGVRQEYSQYSDDEYNIGRAKVLKKFLCGNIFHTVHFSNKYELKANDNVRQEISLLNREKWNQDISPLHWNLENG